MGIEVWPIFIMSKESMGNMTGTQMSSVISACSVTATFYQDHLEEVGWSPDLLCCGSYYVISHTALLLIKHLIPVTQTVKLYTCVCAGFSSSVYVCKFTA